MSVNKPAYLNSTTNYFKNFVELDSKALALMEAEVGFCGAALRGAPSKGKGEAEIPAADRIMWPVTKSAAFKARARGGWRWRINKTMLMVT